MWADLGLLYWEGRDNLVPFWGEVGIIKRKSSGDGGLKKNGKNDLGGSRSESGRKEGKKRGGEVS